MMEQLFQIGIKALIRNKDGKILLLKVPAYGGSPGYWDMPGGRMDPGETFEQTLRRELHEEIGVEYEGTPKQLMAVLSSVTIAVGESRVPLVLLPYEVDLDDDVEIKLGDHEHEEAFDWYSPEEASELLQIKYNPEFCDLVASL
jgi:8-oxo-dGTP pyrophosphatase MutT (NUDIX family)